MVTWANTGFKTAATLIGKIPYGDLSVAVRTSIKIYDHGAIRQRDVSVRDGHFTATCWAQAHADLATCVRTGNGE